MTETEILYKCACNPAEQSVMAPGRRADEDLREWMELCMGPAMYLHHRRASPACRETKTEYVKLRCDNTTWRIGEAPVSH